jgi:hypothetical protein
MCQIKNATGLSNSEDIIAHYQGRANKNQQLHALAEELRQRIEVLSLLIFHGILDTTQQQ